MLHKHVQGVDKTTKNQSNAISVEFIIVKIVVFVKEFYQIYQNLKTHIYNVKIVMLSL
jgi:hypothetical protein